MITYPSVCTIDIAQTDTYNRNNFQQEQEKQLLNLNHKEYDEKYKEIEITSGKYKQHLEERNEKKIKYT